MGDPGGDHPLQRAVDRRPADPGFFQTNEVVQLVRGEVPLLPQEDVENTVAFPRPLPASRAKAREVQSALYSTENDWPQPQVDLAFGFLIVKPPPVMVSTKSTSAPPRSRTLIVSSNSLTPLDS